jgi:hypothetical protein
MKMGAKFMGLSNSANVGISKCKQFNKTNSIKEIIIKKEDINGICKDKGKLLSYIPMVEQQVPELTGFLDNICENKKWGKGSVIKRLIGSTDKASPAPPPSI